MIHEDQKNIATQWKIQFYATVLFPLTQYFIDMYDTCPKQYIEDICWILRKIAFYFSKWLRKLIFHAVVVNFTVYRLFWTPVQPTSAVLNDVINKAHQ